MHTDTLARTGWRVSVTTTDNGPLLQAEHDSGRLIEGYVRPDGTPVVWDAGAPIVMHGDWSRVVGKVSEILERDRPGLGAAVVSAVRDYEDEQALVMPGPGGIRGLAERFASQYAFEAGVTGQEFEPDLLTSHELDTLLGWVRREMGREVERRRNRRLTMPHPNDPRWQNPTHEYDWHYPDIASHVTQMLGGPFTADPHGEHGLAWTLCQAASDRFGGWPS